METGVKRGVLRLSSAVSPTPQTTSSRKWWCERMGHLVSIRVSDHVGVSLRLPARDPPLPHHPQVREKVEDEAGPAYPSVARATEEALQTEFQNEPQIRALLLMEAASFRADPAECVQMLTQVPDGCPPLPPMSSIPPLGPPLH